MANRKHTRFSILRPICNAIEIRAILQNRLFHAKQAEDGKTIGLDTLGFGESKPPGSNTLEKAPDSGPLPQDAVRHRSLHVLVDILDIVRRMPCFVHGCRDVGRSHGVSHDAHERRRIQ